MGGTLTAKAMRDMFVFYGTVPSCNAKKLADILVDVAINGVTCMLHYFLGPLVSFTIKFIKLQVCLTYL